MAKASERTGDSMPLWLTIITIILGGVLFYVNYRQYHSVTTILNGEEYFIAWDNLKNGLPQPLRPPVYPIFIGVLSEVFGQGRALAVIPLIQWIVFVCSLQLVWKINQASKVGNVFNIISILIVYLIPGFWVMNNFAMPESVCIYLVLLTIWLTLKYNSVKQIRYLISGGCCVLVLVFVKPMFIFLIPLMPLYWYCGGKRKKRHLLAGIALLAITISSLCVYACWMRSNFGVFGLSEASSMNKYQTLRQAGLITPDNISDTQLRLQFQKYYEKDPGVQAPYSNRYWNEICGDNFVWAQTEAIAYETIAKHPTKAACAALAHFEEALPYSHFHCLQPQKYDSDKYLANWNGITPARYSTYIFPFQKYLNFPIWGGLLTTAVYILLFVRRWFREHKLPIAEFIVSSLMSTAYITVILSAPDCWGRILTPVNILLTIMWATICSRLWRYYIKSY